MSDSSSMTDNTTSVEGGVKEPSTTKEDVKKEQGAPTKEQSQTPSSSSSSSETATSTTQSEPAKDSENPAQTASVKSPNGGGFRAGNGGGAGKRMMAGYRPIYPMKSEICQDFAKGTCSRGLHCPFLHVAPAGSANALAMTRGGMNHSNNTQKNAAKTDGQGDGGVKKASKKKKKKNAAKKAQENAAENAAGASSATAAATTATEGEEKPATQQDQGGKGKKSKNQRRQNPADVTSSASSPAASSSSAAASTDSTAPTNAKQSGRKHRTQGGGGGGGRQMMTIPNVGNAVCVNYVLGSCRYGRSCEFLHPEGALNPAGMVCPFYAAGSCGYGLYCIFSHILPTDPGYHLKPCLMNRMGSCPNGDACVFYHEKPNPRRAFDSRSTVNCTFWMHGYCSKGENCPFAHPDEYWALQTPFDRNSLNGGSTGDDQQQKSKEQKSKSGKVETSSSSSTATTTVPKSQILCKYWAQGNCPAGDKCEYRHDLFLHSTTKSP